MRKRLRKKLRKNKNATKKVHIKKSLGKKYSLCKTFMFTLKEIEKTINGYDGMSEDAKDGLLDAFKKSSETWYFMTGSNVLPFGKFKGKTLQEVLQENTDACVGYCKWLINAKDSEDGSLWVEKRFKPIFIEAHDIFEKFGNRKRQKIASE